MKDIKKQIDVSRVATEHSVDVLNEEIKHLYLEIYDHYFSEKQNLDDAILKDLINILEYIRAIYSVYTTNFDIDPVYVLEMLNRMKKEIDSNIRYFEQKERSVKYE